MGHNNLSHSTKQIHPAWAHTSLPNHYTSDTADAATQLMMLQPRNLQVPTGRGGGGKSRFSKALPEIPGIDTSVAHQPTVAPVTISIVAPKELPEAPPPPPPHDSKIPIQFTALPALPTAKRASEIAKPVIRRKAVGSADKQQETEKQAQSQMVKMDSLEDAVPEIAQLQSQNELKEKAKEDKEKKEQKEPAPLPQLPLKIEEAEKAQHTAIGTGTSPHEHHIQPPLSSQPSQPSEFLSPTQFSESSQPSLIIPDTPPSSACLNGYTNEYTLQEISLAKPLSPLFLDARLSSLLPQPKSPSVSSILSAYSRSSTESIHRSSDGTFSARDSANDSPYEVPSTSKTSKKSQKGHEAFTSVSTVRVETKTPQPDHKVDVSSPPPPAPISKDRPSSPRPVLPPKPDVVAPSSPPRQQIWRRRSVNGSRELPNLRLDTISHGSTASTTSISSTQSKSTIVPAQHSQKPLEFSSVSPVPPQPPPKGPVGLPGNNFRPAQAEQPANTDTMPSMFGKLKDTLHRVTRSKDDSNRSKGQRLVNQPPTPEYQKEEIKTPVVSTFVAPNSPIPSPEAAKRNISKQLPQQPSEFEELPPLVPAKSESRSIVRKAVGSGSRNNSISTSNPSLPPKKPKSFPDIGMGPAPQNPTVPLPSLPANPSSGKGSPGPNARDSPRGPRSPGPSARSSSRGRPPGPNAHDQPRGRPPGPRSYAPPGGRDSPGPGISDLSSGRGSPGPGIYGPHNGRGSPAPNITCPQERSLSGIRKLPRLNTLGEPDLSRPVTPSRAGLSVTLALPSWLPEVTKPTGEVLYRGEHSTLYPDMKEQTEVDSKAVYFPIQNTTPISAGTIFASAPLKFSHYHCYHGHRRMKIARNTRYPLSCQTCKKEDNEDRWYCFCCFLRICMDCRTKFNNNGRDLSKLMEGLASDNASSPRPRPGSMSAPGREHIMVEQMITNSSSPQPSAVLALGKENIPP